MAKVETIVVGGGIGAVAPFTLNSVPYVSATDPASLSTTDFFSVVATGANRGVIVSTSGDPLVSANRLRVKGGIVSEHADVAGSVVLGQSQTVTGSFTAGPVLIGRNLTIDTAAASANEPVLVGPDISVTSSAGVMGAVVAVGSNITISAATYQGIVIGRGITSSAPGGGEVLIGNSVVSGTGQFHVVIGDGAQANGSGANCVLIGRNVSKASGVNNSVVVGNDATISNAAGVQSVVIGFQASTVEQACVVIGSGSSVGTAGHTNNILIGPGLVSFQANTAMIGSNTFSQRITTLLIGGPNTLSSTAPNLLIRMINATGTDIGAGTLTLQAGLATGNAAGGSIILQVGDRVAGTGSALQTAVTAVTVETTTASMNVICNAPTGKNSDIQFRVNNVLESIIGVAGAVNGLITGSAATETCIRNDGARILFSTDSGSTIAASFTTAGVLTLEKDRGVRFNAQTNAAGASAGTLGNAPAAGDPTFWLKVNIDGVNRAIPCWAG